MAKTQERILAKELFFQFKLQNEIARIVGVQEKTIGDWIKKFSWKKERDARFNGAKNQTHQIKREILFPKQYHYRASLTQDVILGMQELVESIEREYGSLDKKLVLDIGCNDGSLLKIFNSKGSKATGIEPTNAYKDVRHPRIEILNTYLDSTSTDEYINRFGQPDLITFTNVFAHIDDLNLVIDNLKKLCK